jgi:hypothetical protein
MASPACLRYCRHCVAVSAELVNEHALYLSQVINADLANDVGNLLNRCLKPLRKHSGDTFPKYTVIRSGLLAPPARFPAPQSPGLICTLTALAAGPRCRTCQAAHVRASHLQGGTRRVRLVREGGTRRVHLVRGGGGGGVLHPRNPASARGASEPRSPLPTVPHTRPPTVLPLTPTCHVPNPLEGQIGSDI